MINYYPLIFYALLLFFWQAVLNAQCPEEEELIFSTQAEIDQFIVDYPNCTTVSNMYVSGVDITNLNGLVNIESIFGDLSLQNCPLLTDISGMANLSSVEHELIIFNTGIVTIDENDFSLLSYLASLSIRYNNSLESITGFENLTWLYHLTLSGNTNLIELNAFNNLVSVEGGIHFISLPNIVNLGGFESLESSEFSFLIRDLPILNDIGVFGEFTSFGFFRIQNQPWTDLDFFSNLLFVDGIRIGNNLSLMDINGLSNVINSGLLDVYGNVMLDDCCIFSSLANFSYGGISFNNNGENCNDFESIIYECEILPNCPIGDLNFTTQAEIDQFIIDYPNCTVANNLNVSGEDITNLDGLANIENVLGIVSLQDSPLLTDISGMANLSSVEHELIIFNTGIVTIDENDFGSLTYLGFQLTISSNENLQSITGFQGLNELYNLVIEHNPVLTNLNAFNNLTGLGDVHFSYLSSLESVDGFNSLGTFGLGLLNINSTPLLFDLGVLSEIEVSSLEINNVPWTSLDLFSSNAFWFSISISNCPNLVDISQLVNIGGCSYFYVFNNPNLSECCTLSYLIDFNNGFIELYIDNNAYGCNSLDEIELECIIIPSCPPSDLTFTSQAELNQFLIDYPNCPQIFGNITISGNDIINLDALTNIEHISGDFIIVGNQTLMEISGFVNLQTIGGALTISDNVDLQIISGFQNLATVAGDVEFSILPSLTTIYNFNSLTNVGGSFQFTQLGLLQNLSAFFNLESVAASFTLANNNQINDLNNFCSLTTVGALNISNNENLTDCCSIQPLAQALQSTDITIENNAFGCNSLTEIDADCQAQPVGTCPSGDLDLYSQAEIDQFAIDYPNCTEINGYLSISGEDIISLDALQNIETIAGDFYISGTTLLTEINGFNKLESVGGSLVYIDYNQGLVSVNGFNNLKSHIAELGFYGNENLESVEGFESLTSIYNILFYNCPSLVSVTNFANLTTVEGSLSFWQTPALQSINAFSALESIIWNLSITNTNYFNDLSAFESLTTVGGLNIHDNSGLSNCCIISQFISEETIWDDINIHSNAVGCNSYYESYNSCIEEKCPEGDLIFTSQAEIDQFIIDYPYCAEIDGNVELAPINGSILNLNGLQNLTLVTGNISISGTDIMDLNGLENLYYVGGDFTIINNLALDSIHALNGFNYIGGSLTLADNTSLAACCAISEIQNAVEGTIDVYNNTNGCISLAEIVELCTPVVLGCMDVTACNYDANANTDDGSCIYATGCDVCDGEGGVIDNLDLGEACDDGDETTINDSIQADCNCLGVPIVTGCMDDTACNYDENANVNDGSCIYATGCDICNGQGGVIDNLEVGEACNDGDETTINDIIQEDCSCVGVAIVLGCMDIVACNYDANANTDDGNCIYATGCDVCDGEGGLIDNLEEGDACDDGDETTINDSIQADCSCLGVPIVMGCMDLTACNYDENANVDDGNCIYATGCDVCDGAGGVIDNLEVGEACDDGDENTINDIIQPDCSCSGTLSCPTGDVLISNQAELLQFIENYTNCTEIVGNLVINGDAITDIGFLQNIVSVNGSCAIVGTSLSDLSGLENLTYIGGDLQILSNPLLQNIDVLTNVSFIGYDLNVESNASLTTCCIILDLIEATNNQYLIQNNAMPCESFEAIESTCTVNINGITSNKASNLLVMISGGHLSFKFKITNQNLDAIIYDINGRQMLKSSLAAQQQTHHIKITALPIGTYFLVVKDNEHLLTAKFFKK